MAKVYRRVFRNRPKTQSGPADASIQKQKEIAAQKAKRQEEEARKAKEEAARKDEESKRKAEEAAKKAREDAYKKIKDEAAAREAEKEAVRAAIMAAASSSQGKSKRQFPKCQSPQKLDLVTADATRMEALCVKSQMLNRSSNNQWWKNAEIFDEIKTQLTRSPSSILPSTTLFVVVIVVYNCIFN